MNNYEPSNSKREDNNYWLNNFDIKDFGIRLTELGKNTPINKNKVKKEYSILWGEWRLETKQIFNYGYHEDHFHSSYINANQNERTTRYTSNSFESRWKITEIKQKGHVFYISSAPVDEIAQTSYVPSLPTKLKISNTAKRILDKGFKKNEWQRDLDSKRSLKISQFIQESSNIVANTPMLYVNTNHGVKIVNDELIISYESFLQKVKVDNQELYVDRIEEGEDEAGNQIYKEFRPLWLVDGQHRIKGIHNSTKPLYSENYHTIKIPIIIFPYEFGAEETAKIFAEINTLQKKLNPLHELFMQHRFKIDHESQKRKFKDYKKITYLEACREGWGNGWLDSRANHLSYEIAALLASKGVLKDQIQFLPQNDKSKTLVSADQWVNYCRKIFFNCYMRRPDGIESWISNPSDEESKMNELDFFYEEMNNYFMAWIEICNHEEWDKDKPKSWNSDLTSKRGLLQNRAHFIILLEIYNLVKDMVEENMIDKHQRKIRTKDDFSNVLKVFKWVDWTDRNLRDTYTGVGEIGRRSLEAWMSDAILNGKTYKYDEIHSENREYNMSKPGRGICSYLGVPEIKIKSENDWPTRESPLILESKRPFNARYEATWSVFDKKRNLIEEKKSSCGSRHLAIGISRFSFKNKIEIKDEKELIILVEWRNSYPRTGKKEITVYRN